MSDGIDIIHTTEVSCNLEVFIIISDLTDEITLQ